MVDPADVVPLRRGGSTPFGEPAALFADVSDPARALSLTWSPDQRAIRFGVESCDGSSGAVVVSADDLLDLVRAVMDGLPRPDSVDTPVATVIPLRSRQPHPFTEDS